MDPEQLDKCNAGTLRSWNSLDRLWTGLFQGKTRDIALRAVLHSQWLSGLEDPEAAADEFIEILNAL